MTILLANHERTKHWEIAWVPTIQQGPVFDQERLQTAPLRQFIRQHKDAIWYLGIAYDEDKHLKSMDKNAISLLEKYKITQEGARKICKRYKLLSPIYEFSPRGGCFFCPNAKDRELKHLRDHHPELWNRLLKMQSDQRVVRPNSFGFDLTLLDYENNFDFDDRQITWESLTREEWS